MQAILLATTAVFGQIREQLGAISDQSYGEPLPVLSQNSIGKHLRHILEFYTCLIEQSPRGVICYDKRARNQALETSVSHAIDCLHRIQQALPDLATLEGLALESHFEAQSQIIATTGIRELLYNYEHAIHHLAMVRIGLQVHFPDIACVPDLGIAPSTLCYLRNQSSDCA
ncbi:MAG: hypothetical protein ACFCUI_12920 [Bernardetiaceae bacterium]